MSVLERGCDQERSRRQVRMKRRVVGTERPIVVERRLAESEGDEVGKEDTFEAAEPHLELTHLREAAKELTVQSLTGSFHAQRPGLRLPAAPLNLRDFGEESRSEVANAANLDPQDIARLTEQPFDILSVLSALLTEVVGPAAMYCDARRDVVCRHAIAAGPETRRHLA